MIAFWFEISASFVAVGFGKLDTVCCFRKVLASGFFAGSFKSHTKGQKVFLFVQAVFRWTVWRFAFFCYSSLLTPGIKMSAGLQAVFGGKCGCILLQKFFGLDTLNTFLFKQFLRLPIAFDLKFKQ